MKARNHRILRSIGPDPHPRCPKGFRITSSVLTPQGFMKSGQQTVLNGHTKRVSCCLAVDPEGSSRWGSSHVPAGHPGLMTHQQVLLSGASDGAVRCWQMNPHTTTFE